LPEVLPGTLEQDMVRRDFRINAMYVPFIELAARGDLLNRDVVEGLAMGPKGFREDVLNQVVDVFHERSFIDDTTRVFRAYRYRERIRGIFSKSVVSLVTTSVNHQSLIEMEGVRVAGEFSRLLESPNAGAVIDQMIGDGVVESLGILDQEATSLASKLLKALVGVELTPHLQKQVLLQVLWNCFRQSRRQLFSTEEWNQLFGISVKMHNRWVREWAMVESGQIGKQELSIAGKVVFDLYRAV
jgi:tRNA nucleotidyltransferase/poly(A) polymerase